MQPQPHTSSQSYRFLVVSLHSSMSWGAGDITETWDNQDCSLSQNHHRCHGDFIILILSTGWVSICLPLEEKKEKRKWAGFRLYAANCAYNLSVFQEGSTDLRKEKQEMSRESRAAITHSLKVKGWHPDCERGLVFRRKTESNWGNQAKGWGVKNKLRHIFSILQTTYFWRRHFELRIFIFTILMGKLHKLRYIFFFHNLINKLFSEEKFPEHCLKLEGCQGAPNINK